MEPRDNDCQEPDFQPSYQSQFAEDALVFQEKLFSKRKSPGGIWILSVSLNLRGTFTGDWRSHLDFTPQNQKKMEIIKKKPSFHEQIRMFNWPQLNVDFNHLDGETLLKIPPTDSRLRPDIKALEFGDLALAEEQKLKMEKNQRTRRAFRKVENIQHSPKWSEKYFDHDSGEISWGYKGGYWEHREEYYNRNVGFQKLKGEI